MNQTDIMQRIEQLRLVPVVKIDRVEDAVPLCGALKEGGLPVAEITFRTQAAEESIKRVVKAFGDVLVGAGTVINVEQAKRALGAGAKFLVSPGFSKSVTEYALKENVPIFPGTCTPTEIMMALEYGLSVVKFFPAKQYGGLSTIKALAAPFPSIRFMPTGGISEENVKEFLAYERIVAVGGSWMVKESLFANGSFDKVKEATASAVKLIQK